MVRNVSQHSFFFFIGVCGWMVFDQIAFVGFIQCEGRFRLTSSLKGFLATCVANWAWNRNKAKRKHVPDEAVAETAAPENERPDLAAMFGDELRSVARALAELPYEQREAVVW